MLGGGRPRAEVEVEVGGQRKNMWSVGMFGFPGFRSDYSWDPLFWETRIFVTQDLIVQSCLLSRTV